MTRLLHEVAAPALAAVAQSVLDPAGTQAAHISRFWWLHFWICAVVYVWVVIALFLAVARRRPAPQQPDSQPVAPPHKENPARERRMGVVIAAAVGVTVVILFVLLIGDFLAGRRIYALAAAPDQLEIKIVARQWWWEAEYQDPTPSNIFTTANEIHIPLGTPVMFVLDSRDVIHSFWVPNLHGKKDLIPGHPTRIWLKADRPGTYDGQCAEFCGHQHAHMRFTVVAEDRAAFDAWRDAQRKPASEPADQTQARGREVFLRSSCVLCHTIGGTGARGRVGPSLTHVGSRATIAAGTLANTPENRRAWIRNPQEIKPGVVMPQHTLADEDLAALSQYLGGLR